MIYFSYPESMDMDVNDKNISAGLGEQILSPSEFKLKYPLIEELENKVAEDAINDLIVSLEGLLFTDHAIVKKKKDLTDVVSDYKVPLNEKGLISMLFELYIYENHAAHGMTYYGSITANLETGETYGFSDLFNSKVYYTRILSEIAVKKVKAMGVPLIAPYNGITDDQQFYLTPDSLVLYYKIYEFTPYYYGNFEIKIPYNEIINILGPLSPIKNLLH
ncbi:DUF3298 and DUF4163 domain-containing protein [Candidatus Clostridium stratigraminis]|uniref:DUF3298 domain-containing protein n=1 Tax=Candidatus Clostridium stratigraminis TaxID=3381661 RepID=A0ABW8T2C7_9CLOT